jgi:hypothetical protein
MMPGDRLVCVLPKPLAVHNEFKNWPLHVTIVPWFRLGLDTRQITNDLSEVLYSVKSFSVVMSEENVRFGHQKGKLATLVRLPSPLIEIEQIVRSYLRNQNAWMVDESTKRLRCAFRPHITAQLNGSLHEGDSFWCDGLYIVEQKGGYKEIVGKVGVGNA